MREQETQEATLVVNATLSPRGSRADASATEPTMAGMAAQLQEAKQAALEAAERMAALLKQMEVMEATAAKNRLNELAIEERIAATASAAAASSSGAAANTVTFEVAPGAAPSPSVSGVDAAGSETSLKGDDSKRGRQITMTDVYGEDDDKAGQVRTRRPDPRRAQRTAQPTRPAARPPARPPGRPPAHHPPNLPATYQPTHPPLKLIQRAQTRPPNSPGQPARPG